MENEKSVLNTAVAAEIRAERAAKNMTAAQLAKAAGIPIGTLHRVLSGERDINVTQLGKIALAFGTTVEHIMRRAVDRAGGLDALAPRQMSDAGGNVTPIRKRVEDLSVDELEAIDRKAATRDAEMDTDEHFD
jgi:transcriptional regulator with XRE-family HTH domain